MSDGSSSDDERVKTFMENYEQTAIRWGTKCPFCNKDKQAFKDLKALEQHATTFGGRYVEKYHKYTMCYCVTLFSQLINPFSGVIAQEAKAP
jgi:hypothetical protein